MGSYDFRFRSEFARKWKRVLLFKEINVEFWGKSIYNFAGNSQSRGNQKTISKRIRSEFDAKFASWKSALKGYFLHINGPSSSESVARALPFNTMCLSF